MNLSDYLRAGWGPLMAAFVTAAVAIAVARWSQPTHKARWEAINTQLEVIEKLHDSDAMRPWMQRYVDFELRSTARRAVDVGLAGWQWLIVFTFPVIAVVVWIVALIDISRYRDALDTRTIGYRMCLDQGILDNDCTTEALAPQTVTSTYQNATYLTCFTIGFALAFFAIFSFYNNRLGIGNPRKLFMNNAERRSALTYLAHDIPRVPIGKIDADTAEVQSAPDMNFERPVDEDTPSSDAEPHKSGGSHVASQN